MKLFPTLQDICVRITFIRINQVFHEHAQLFYLKQ